jgi:hypothetical protein
VCPNPSQTNPARIIITKAKTLVAEKISLKRDFYQNLLKTELYSDLLLPGLSWLISLSNN